MRSLLVLFALASPLAAQQPAEPFAAVRPTMQAFIDSGELAGAVTVVGRRTGEPSLVAVGSADLEAKRPMAADTLFRIASMTKPVTALAVLMLQEDGKLNIEDPVEKYLPEFTGQMLVESRSAGKLTLVKPARPITLRDLLTHTSGLPAGYPAGFGPVYFDRKRTLAETTLVISQQPLAFPPGSKWSYCNAGIDTLGRVVEVVSGVGYADFLKARLFLPLGMTDTTFNPTAGQLQRLAVLYKPGADGKLEPTPGNNIAALTHATHPIPAGGLCSTGPDMAKLYQCLLNGGERDGRRVIGKQTLDLMTKTQTGDIPTGFTNGMSYGFGFAVVKEPQGVTAMLKPGAFGHGGAFATQSWADPAQDLFFILMIQRTGLPNADASEFRRVFQDAAVKSSR